MSVQLNQLCNKIDELSTQKSGFVLMICLLSIFVFWKSCLLTPLKNDRKAISMRIAAINNQTSALQLQTDTIIAAATKRPDQAAEKKHAVLAKKAFLLNERLSVFSNELVEPEEMVESLKSLLSLDAGLNLTRFDSLPTVTLSVGAKATKQSENKDIYEHGLSLEFQGDYLHALAYLHRLEQLEWYLFWDSIDYRVTEYPQATIVLKLHSLNTKESWLSG